MRLADVCMVAGTDQDAVKIMERHSCLCFVPDQDLPVSCLCRINIPVIAGTLWTSVCVITGALRSSIIDVAPAASRCGMCVVSRALLVDLQLVCHVQLLDGHNFCIEADVLHKSEPGGHGDLSFKLEMMHHNDSLNYISNLFILNLYFKFKLEIMHQNASLNYISNTCVNNATAMQVTNSTIIMSI